MAVHIDAIHALGMSGSVSKASITRLCYSHRRDSLRKRIHCSVHCWQLFVIQAAANCVLSCTDMRQPKLCLLQTLFEDKQLQQTIFNKHRDELRSLDDRINEIRVCQHPQWQQCMCLTASAARCSALHLKPLQGLYSFAVSLVLQ